MFLKFKALLRICYFKLRIFFNISYATYPHFNFYTVKNVFDIYINSTDNVN